MHPHPRNLDALQATFSELIGNGTLVDIESEDSEYTQYSAKGRETKTAWTVSFILKEEAYDNGTFRNIAETLESKHPFQFEYEPHYLLRSSLLHTPELTRITLVPTIREAPTFFREIGDQLNAAIKQDPARGVLRFQQRLKKITTVSALRQESHAQQFCNWFDAETRPTREELEAAMTRLLDRPAVKTFAGPPIADDLEIVRQAIAYMNEYKAKLRTHVYEKEYEPVIADVMGLMVQSALLHNPKAAREQTSEPGRQGGNSAER